MYHANQAHTAMLEKIKLQPGVLEASLECSPKYGPGGFYTLILRMCPPLDMAAFPIDPYLLNEMPGSTNHNLEYLTGYLIHEIRHATEQFLYSNYITQSKIYKEQNPFEKYVSKGTVGEFKHQSPIPLPPEGQPLPKELLETKAKVKKFKELFPETKLNSPWGKLPQIEEGFTHPVTSQLSKVLPNLTTKVECPACKGIGLNNIAGTIMHLNDAEHWTREQIADWLESLDVDLQFKEIKDESSAGF